MSAEHASRGATLRATGVTAGYGGDPVIRDITVHVEPGQVVSLVGANGSGKSTLLKSLVGVVRVSAGTVTVGEADVLLEQRTGDGRGEVRGRLVQQEDGRL